VHPAPRRTWLLPEAAGFATMGGWFCYNRAAALLPAPSVLLPIHIEAGRLLPRCTEVATMARRHCCQWPPRLLPSYIGVATIARRRCCSRSPGLLQRYIGAATMYHIRCYNPPPCCCIGDAVSGSPATADVEGATPACTDAWEAER
jgi:hypothetical protein